MSTPNASGRSARSSVHLAAADALAALIAQGETWPPASPLRFRNLLFDACGSDYRPLIELLLRVGRHGIVDALRSLGTVPAFEWPTRRTTLVSRVCGELFIGAEMAAWAVDAWAVALGAVPRSAARALQVEYATSASRARLHTDAALSPNTRPAHAPAALASPVRPGIVGGQTQTRVGAGKHGAAAAIMASPRRRVPAPSMPAPNMKPYYSALAVVAVVMLGAVLWVRVSTRESPAPAASGAPFSAPSAGDVAATAETAETAETAATPGRSPPRSRPGSSFVSIHGTALASTGSIRKTGVGGTYTVQQRIVSVAGSALCDPLADALGRRAMQSEEQFTHAPDSAQFALTSRPGVHGVIEPDGVFITVPYRATQDGVRFAFQMSGRFTGTGFIARTLTQTDAVIRYRRQQRCVVVADLIGSRVSPVGEP